MSDKHARLEYYPNLWVQIDWFGKYAHLFVPNSYPRVRPLCMPETGSVSMWVFDDALQKRKHVERCPECLKLRDRLP